MKTVLVKRAFLVLAPLILFGIYACAHTGSMATWHPVEVPALPMCSDCHTDARAALDHTVDFPERHRFYAEQTRMCSVCHKESFCSDCHAHKEELKPSDKYQDSPERTLPHRGDYINQHKIDGQINPAACMKCHGRTNNERCLACHR